MLKEKPLVEANYLLEKFPGKGGWTYAEIPEVLQNNNNPFGWVTVKGFVDGYELKRYKLMPMGNGRLFLPVKATIRKKIKKEAREVIRIILYEDNSKLVIPDEIRAFFSNEPKELFETFSTFAEGEQKAYLDWIASVKREEAKTCLVVMM